MSKTQKQSKGGRPPVDTEAVTLRLPRDMIEAVEAFRREQPKIPTRPEAIRIVLRDWLEVNGLLKP